MGALFYLEYRTVVNVVRDVLRSPMRLVFWLLFAAWMAAIVASRVFVSSHMRVAYTSTTLFRPGAPTAAFGAVALIIGGQLMTGSRGRVDVFSSPAEGWMFALSRLDSRRIALWLQIRAATTRALRYLWPVFIQFAIFTSYTASGASLVTGIVVATAISLVLTMTPLPIFLAVRYVGRTRMLAAGIAVALAGLVYGIVGLAEFSGEHRPLDMLTAITHVPVEAFAARVIAGGPAVGALIAAMLVGCLFAVVPLGRDALPELAAAANVTRESLAKGRTHRLSASRNINVGRAKGRAVPTGPWTILWIEWIEFVRSPLGFAMWVIGCLLSAGLGFATIVGRRYGFDGVAWALMDTSWSMAIAVPVFATIRLRSDFAFPLWWIGATSIRMRVFAWTVSRSWRIPIALSLSLIVAAAGAGAPGLAVAALPAVALAWWFLQTEGVLLVSIFPNTADQRGPLLVLRLILMLALLVPPILAGALAFALSHDVVAMGFTAAIVLALEGLANVVLAVLRIESTGIMLASPE